MAGKISKAYPNYNQFISFPNPHDTPKWLETVKNMYYFVHKGLDKKSAFDKATSGWSDMEKKDFTQWLKYYEENAHKKYAEETSTLPSKLAQVSYWQDVNRAGYFVPITPDPAKQIEDAKNPLNNQAVLDEEKRELIEKQRSKILSRLDSAEKLIRSRDGQVFAGKEFEALLHIIYDLKKKIQTVNKVSVASRIYEDLIVREANRLTKQGFKQASGFLVKIAQDATPNPAEASNPLEGKGLPGNLPGEAPGQNAPGNNPPASIVEEPLSEGMRGFLEGLDTNKITSEEDLEVNEVEDTNLVVEAQVAPSAPAQKQDVKPEAEIEVEEEVSTGKDFDDLVDRAFANLTVADVVNKLEDLAKIFKVREVPRQLAMVDMMLERLGLASLFPTLAEAMNKSLDSNQYIASRIEDILSRLRGTIATKDIDLKTETVNNTPEAQNIKKRLETENAKEKQRKQKRKEQEQAELDAEETPAEIEVEEDLEEPAKLTNQMPEGTTPPAPEAKAPAPVR